MHSGESHTWPSAIGIPHQRHLGRCHSFHQAFSSAHIAAILALLAFTAPAQAGPLDWIPRAAASAAEWTNHHKRFLVVKATAIGASTFEAAAVHRCRHRNGVEPCLAHYGEAWATFGVDAGFSTVVLPAIAEGCWKNTDNSRWCDPLAYVFPAGQTIFSVREWRTHETHSDSGKPDLSSVALLRR